MLDADVLTIAWFIVKLLLALALVTAGIATLWFLFTFLFNTSEGRWLVGRTVIVAIGVVLLITVIFFAATAADNAHNKRLSELARNDLVKPPPRNDQRLVPEELVHRLADVDRRAWINPEVEVICSSADQLLASYALDGKTKNVTAACTLRNKTARIIPIAHYADVDSILRLPNGVEVYGKGVYLGSNKTEIPPNGTVEHAGLFTGTECAVRIPDRECLATNLWKSRELLLMDRSKGTRYVVKMALP